MSTNTHCKWCSALGCSNSRNKRPDLSFFRFPTDAFRCKEWVLYTQRADLMSKTVEALSKSNYLCAEHFEPTCFVDTSPNRFRTRLKKTAVPTLFYLPAIPSEPLIVRGRKYTRKKPFSFSALDLSVNREKTEQNALSNLPNSSVFNVGEVEESRNFEEGKDSEESNVGETPDKKIPAKSGPSKTLDGEDDELGNLIPKKRQKKERMKASQFQMRIRLSEGQSLSTDIEEIDAPMDVESDFTHPTPDPSTAFDSYIADVNESMNSLKKKLNKERVKTFRLRKRIERLQYAHEQQRLQNNNKIDETALREILLQHNLSSTAVDFVMTQIRVSKQALRGRRWGPQDIEIALSFYQASRKAYRLLQKIFMLPSIKTLQNLKNPNIQPSVSSESTNTDSTIPHQLDVKPSSSHDSPNTDSTIPHQLDVQPSSSHDSPNTDSTIPHQLNVQPSSSHQSPNIHSQSPNIQSSISRELPNIYPTIHSALNCYPSNSQQSPNVHPNISHQLDRHSPATSCISANIHPSHSCKEPILHNS